MATTTPNTARHRQIVQAALAGAGSGLPAAVQVAADAIGPAASPAAALLQAGLLLSEAERCARPLARLPTPLPEPAPAETLAACTPALRPVLAEALEPAEFAGLRRELAALLRARGERLPGWTLPAWLDAALAEPPAARPALLAAGGSRAAWLAARNPHWRPLLGTPLPDALWQEGSPAERVAWLEQARARDPDDARAALEAAWPTEPPEARAALLPALAVGLGPGDEPLLEAARTDKRRDVRAAALDLLAALPASAFQARALARLRAWLAVTPGGLLRKPQLAVTLPEVWQKEWAHEGLSEKSARAHEQVGDKAGWLLDTVARLPMPTVLAAFGIDAPTWVVLAAKSDYAAALRLGTLASLQRRPHLPTVLALVAAESNRRQTPGLLAEAIAAAAADAGAVNADAQGARAGDTGWLEPWLRGAPLQVAAALERLPPLTTAQHQQLLDAFEAEVKQAEGNGRSGWSYAATGLAAALPPALLPRLQALLERLAPLPWHGKELERLRALPLCRLRGQLHAIPRTPAAASDGTDTPNTPASTAADPDPRSAG